jgi:hypothetical protein
VTDGALGLPMEQIYSDEVQGLRQSGRRVAEATGLAARRLGTSRNVLVFLGLTRLVVHYAQLQNLDDLLVTVNPRQAAFYEKTLQFEPLGALKHYPSVQNAPALGFRLNLRDLASQQLTNPRAYARYFRSPVDGLSLLTQPTMEDQEYFAEILLRLRGHELAHSDCA